ncbi:aminoglycoside phosphotransferase [Shewanella halifaxensis HAW-EB4]|uniref:Aminoglycoside phosphotransferase n=1 Tax=Shewanella halifaxensis (strain HAW-EB4) TaxID=458817 RepID=B0TQH7_SHEHH|nr:aminoglycoside phosphotransferase family protein [Shewanella halifaxensis]ABZ74970.1 aminoglycoside phosphotransferase [Shewanella halifaxensis HAW-EB4]
MIDFIRQNILSHFGIDAASAKVSPLGNGHINHTFLVRGNDNEFVLQKINTDVFKTPSALVNNADKISQHLQMKAAAGEYQLQVVSPELTASDELFVDLGEQGFWRAINYLPFSHSIDVVGSEADAEMAAKAFGHFSCALTELDAELLEDVIPNFHHLPGRIELLAQAVEADSHGRLVECKLWVDFVMSQSELLQELAEVEGKLPRRICHNDTKINNMLFDKRDMTSLAIIDLDTCMKGYLMYDFGDMVRTFYSPEEEDSTALDKVLVRESIFGAICSGYLSELGAVLSEQERKSLWLGARVMCLMIGVRFLTDHLNGDVYFQIHHAGHNLERAANQFTLYQSLLSQQEVLCKFLQS